jgi:hypothetical protein
MQTAWMVRRVFIAVADGSVVAAASPHVVVVTAV